MPHKDKEARNAYMREYKARRRLDPNYLEQERAKERERYAITKNSTSDARLEKNARYRAKHRKELAEKERVRTAALKSVDPLAHASRIRERSMAFRLRHKDDASYIEANREAARKSYRKVKDDPDFKQKNVKRVTEWVAKNRQKRNATARRIRATRYASDIQYKLAKVLRTRLYMAVRNTHRSGIAVRELGCSIQELKSHLEQMFIDGMSWENWGRSGWHIDHIKPITRFDLTDPKQVAKACHFTNLQPLWASDNLRKGNSYVE